MARNWMERLCVVLNGTNNEKNRGAEAASSSIDELMVKFSLKLLYL
jgi:hypothetical protein